MAAIPGFSLAGGQGGFFLLGVVLCGVVFFGLSGIKIVNAGGIGGGGGGNTLVIAAVAVVVVLLLLRRR